MITYKQAYMTKQAGWLGDTWNTIQNGLMTAQEGISNFFGGTGTAVGRLFAPSLERQAQVRLGFHAPTGGSDTDYFGSKSPINQRIDRNIAHLQAADKGLEARTPKEMAARVQAQKIIANRVKKQQDMQNWNNNMRAIAANDAKLRNDPAARQKVIADNERARQAMLARQRDPKAQAAFEADVNRQIAASRQTNLNRQRTQVVKNRTTGSGAPAATRAT